MHKGNQRALYARAGGVAMADGERAMPVSLPKGLLGDAAADCSGIWVSGTDWIFECGCRSLHFSSQSISYKPLTRNIKTTFTCRQVALCKAAYFVPKLSKMIVCGTELVLESSGC